MRTFTFGGHDRHPTELAAQHGARLVTASETEQAVDCAEAHVKALTEGEPIRLRFVCCDECRFRLQLKLVIVGNHRPHLRRVGKAVRQPLRIGQFEHKPANINPNLEDELLAAAGGRILK